MPRGRQKGDGRGQQGGGRKKGTPNRVTAETRELLRKFVENKWDEFIADYDAIENPKDKCYIMVSILPFVSPKLANIEYKDKDNPKTFQDELDELSGEITRG